MLHKSYQTGMLPNLSNAALLKILWVKCFSTKGGRWKAFSASLSAGLFEFL